jgi:hypothetical protein
MSNSEELDLEKLNREMAETEASIKKLEEESKKNIVKYFDRIHDKLFTFNNIIIAGHFALSKVVDSISSYNILVPIMNLMILIFVEYRMMEKNRFDADISNKSFAEIQKQGGAITKTNLFSLETIISTSIVTAHFLFKLFSTI